MNIDQSSIDERLKKRMEERKKDVEDRKNRKSSFQEEERIPLKDGKGVLLRIVDIPTPVYFSFIKCDDDKTRLIKFPKKEENPSFIIYQIGDRVLEREYMGKDASNKAIYGFPVRESHPDIFNMVYNNGSPQVGRYGANGWIRDYGYPQEACYINVINRQSFSVIKTDKEGEDHEVFYDKNWCVKNGHSLLLVKNMKSVGVPSTVNNALMDFVFPNHGNFLGYDLYITKLTKDPWYTVEKADTLTQRLDSFKDDLVMGPLTKEECSITLYDTKALSKPSSASFIYKHLKNKISLVDKELGTSFMSKLERMIEDEGGQMSEEEASDTSAESEEAPLKKAEVKEEPIQVRSRTRAPSSTSSEVLTIAPFAKDLTEEERAKFIKGVNGEELVWTVDDTADCPKCKKFQPFSLDKFCVYCGSKFS
jgi:hypothetical protein